MLTGKEIDAIRNCVRFGHRLLERVSPKLAADFLAHETAFIKWGAVAKATFPVEKSITFPSQAGTIGVNLLIPQAIRYVVSPTAAEPAYTDYKTNLWEIDLTAGTAAYLLGSAAYFYKASPEDEKHAFLIIMRDGLIEVGTSPRIQQFRLITQAETKYGIWTPHPLVHQTIEREKLIFQYPTVGMIPVYHNFGIRWSAMPRYTGTSVLKLLGLFFYEHDFAPDLKWVS